MASTDLYNNNPEAEEVKISYFEKELDHHFNNENRLMKEMMEANLSKQGWTRIYNFIHNHSHSKFVRYFRSLKK